MVPLVISVLHYWSRRSNKWSKKDLVYKFNKVLLWLEAASVLFKVPYVAFFSWQHSMRSSFALYPS